MGAGASISTPRQGMDADTEVALFTMMTREYEQMVHDDLANEIMFERMKHVRSDVLELVLPMLSRLDGQGANKGHRDGCGLFQICYKAFTPDSGKPSAISNRMLFRRSSDPHRKKREVVYSKGLVR